MTSPKLGTHEVAAWLRHHPTFLQQFPDLALSLVVPRENGTTASLASYQLEVLREKNRELNRRLRELFATSEDNERLAVRTHQLTLALMRQTTRAGVVRALAASLSEDFNGELVRIVLFAPVDGIDDAQWLQVIARDDPALSPFADVIASGEPLCGRLRPDKHALLYGARADEVQASALLALDGAGLVAVGSVDGNRFYPGMGTLFLRMMGDAFAVALARFDGCPVPCGALPVTPTINTTMKSTPMSSPHHIERAELHKTIWRIANDLRGSVDGWDFKSYVLGMLFYRFISENLTEYLNQFSDNSIDLFGDAYEYLMQMYASSAGKSGGEFYTPQEVSELLARITVIGKREVNKVYDPACGSGSLLLKFAKVLGPDNVRLGFFGQEINLTTYNLCRINMFLHDVNYEKFNIAHGDRLMPLLLIWRGVKYDK